MKCEQREAFVDGKPRRLFFMDGLIAGEATSAKAFADGLKAMQGACSCVDMCGGCMLRGQLTRSASPVCLAEHGVSLQLMPDEGPETRL